MTRIVHCREGGPNGASTRMLRDGHEGPRVFTPDDQIFLDIEELHAFAHAIGLRREWFQVRMMTLREPNANRQSGPVQFRKIEEPRGYG